ncbi:shikimate dehydrogenase [Nocardioides zeae]|uniref:shikimate dehydrogenase n=1 Tax=Nocardioides zeae TaxID=1457234 RepID=UPI00286C09A3|nr:shikimate dehydrogenase [Nocardioides zeae]
MSTAPGPTRTAEPTRRCAVVGDPVEHSLSPVLHRAAYVALGLTDVTYDAVRVPAGGLTAHVAGLGPAWRGLSVTMPHKREALALADVRTPLAVAAGGANTLVLGPDGVRADNTDVPGAVAALRERGVTAVSRATVLGGGATAASTALALTELGVRHLTVLVRSPERAAEAVAAVRAQPSAPHVEVVATGAVPVGLEVGDVVVATIPVAGQTPDLVALLASAPVVFEVVYDPWPTPLAAAAAAAGATVVDGLDLLAHQALLQLEQFTGASVAVGVMRDAGRAALAARTACAGTGA